METTDLIGLLGPIVLLLGLLYGALVFVKRFGMNSKGKAIKNLNVNVLSNQMIMPKKYLSLVRVENKIMILGVSENNINLLKEIDYDDTEINEEIENGVESNFWDILKKKMTNQ